MVQSLSQISDVIYFNSNNIFHVQKNSVRYVQKVKFYLNFLLCQCFVLSILADINTFFMCGVTVLANS